MNYLIDTHILLWHSESPKKLSADVLAIIENPENNIFVSHASLWELSIKRSLGKLQFDISIPQLVNTMRLNFFAILDFETTHYQTLERLLFHHHDPFDRMLIAQTIAENMTIITQDSKFEAYEPQVSVLWN